MNQGFWRTTKTEMTIKEKKIKNKTDRHSTRISLDERLKNANLLINVGTIELWVDEKEEEEGHRNRIEARGGLDSEGGHTSDDCRLEWIGWWEGLGVGMWAVGGV
ncbi:unnamed protein product [Dovyalis caffra]|uniref:Uncharacterized protein n=1 Tax=Dovyalis caffra TaxID=77055 RepID=A0AAV1R0Q7_9ROSI|nr:unnamed protein product [Dovyalis caffra]